MKYLFKSKIKILVFFFITLASFLTIFSYLNNDDNDKVYIQSFRLTPLESIIFNPNSYLRRDDIFKEHIIGKRYTAEAIFSNIYSKKKIFSDYWYVDFSYNRRVNIECVDSDVKVLKNIQYGENVIIEGDILDIYGTYLRLDNCSFKKSPS